MIHLITDFHIIQSLNDANLKFILRNFYKVSKGKMLGQIARSSIELIVK